jgi:hypothetical protein
MSTLTKQERIERINDVADILGITVEQLLATQAQAIDRVAEEAEEAENNLPPPPIVYPNVKFRRCQFREYPKICYRGVIRDIEEPVTKYVPQEGGGVKTMVSIRVIPDQFMSEERILKNRVEEMGLANENKQLGIGRQWVLSREEAIENAKQAKANERPLIEREATAAERAAARKAAAEQEAEEEALRKAQLKAKGRKAA